VLQEAKVYLVTNQEEDLRQEVEEVHSEEEVDKVEEEELGAEEDD
jgi:hypothetical protein